MICKSCEKDLLRTCAARQGKITNLLAYGCDGSECSGLKIRNCIEEMEKELTNFKSKDEDDK